MKSSKRISESIGFQSLGDYDRVKQIAHTDGLKDFIREYAQDLLHLLDKVISGRTTVELKKLLHEVGFSNKPTVENFEVAFQHEQRVTGFAIEITLPLQRTHKNFNLEKYKQLLKSAKGDDWNLELSEDMNSLIATCSQDLTSNERIVKNSMKITRKQLQEIVERIITEVNTPEMKAYERVMDCMDDDPTDLSLENLKITEIPAEIDDLTNVVTLDLSGTNISDLKPLAKLNKLQSLNLGRSKVTDLTPIKHLRQLGGLDLDGLNISDISILRNFPNLEILELGNTKIADITPILKLKKLIYLGLSGTPYAKSMRGKELPEIGDDAEIDI